MNLLCCEYCCSCYKSNVAVEVLGKLLKQMNKVVGDDISFSIIMYNRKCISDYCNRLYSMYWFIQALWSSLCFQGAVFLELSSLASWLHRDCLSIPLHSLFILVPMASHSFTTWCCFSLNVIFVTGIEKISETN